MTFFCLFFFSFSHLIIKSGDNSHSMFFKVELFWSWLLHENSFTCSLVLECLTSFRFYLRGCYNDPCRYLESCNVPLTMKRKCQSSSNTTSSNSDDGKQKGSNNNMQVSEGTSHYFSSCRTAWQLAKLLKLRPTRISYSLFSLAEPVLLKDQSGLSHLDVHDKKSSDAATAVVGTSLPLPVPNKPESVVSITSQCSYSSTIVHVGDKKPQPESGTVPW